MNCDAELELHIGIFDVALSFASDAEREAEALHSYAEGYSLRCYKYDRHVVAQSGFSLEDIMRYVYRSTKVTVVMNSPLYRKSSATRFEWKVLTSEFSGESIFVVDLGGASLEALAHRLRHFSSLTDRAAMEVMRRAGRTRDG